MEDFVAYYNLLSKNYLNLSYAQINSSAKSRRFLSSLARAITNFKKIVIKKIKNKNYSTFETVIVNVSLTLSTVHSILSPIVTSIILAIVDGRVVLTELFVADPLLNFVFCLNNNTITSNLFLVIIIFVVLTIYILLEKVIEKKVTFKYYLTQTISIELFQERQLLKTILKKPMEDLK